MLVLELMTISLEQHLKKVRPSVALPAEHLAQLHGHESLQSALDVASGTQLSRNLC